MGFNAKGLRVLGFSAAFLSLIVVCNFWFTRELNGLERTFVLTPTEKQTPVTQQTVIKPSVVSIDPEHDLLAPMAPQADFYQPPRQSSNPAPVYEGHVGTIVAQ